MTKKQKAEYEALTTIEQRAGWLLEQGVTAKICINDETLSPVARAFAAGACITGAGDHESLADAIIAGTEWLASKLPERTTS